MATIERLQLAKAREIQNAAETARAEAIAKFKSSHERCTRCEHLTRLASERLIQRDEAIKGVQLEHREHGHTRMQLEEQSRRLSHMNAELRKSKEDCRLKEQSLSRAETMLRRRQAKAQDTQPKPEKDSRSTSGMPERSFHDESECHYSKQNLSQETPKLSRQQIQDAEKRFADAIAEIVALKHENDAAKKKNAEIQSQFDTITNERLTVRAKCEVAYGQIASLQAKLNEAERNTEAAGHQVEKTESEH